MFDVFEAELIIVMDELANPSRRDPNCPQEHPLLLKLEDYKAHTGCTRNDDA